MRVASLVEALLGPRLPVAFEAYDGSRTGPRDAPATIVIRSPRALGRLARAPGELGFARAYAAGEIDIEGDVYAALSLRERLPVLKLDLRQWAAAVRLATAQDWRGLSSAPGEIRLHGRRHSRARDAAAISHHYDVSNGFYRLVLGPSMTYSCAVWSDEAAGLESAQAAKHDLVCRKLGLQPGMRLLDVGCGWGGLVLHAAQHYGIQAVGVTLSQAQAAWAARAVEDAGLGDQVDIRHQDYRDVQDRAFDAISSIGMFEHVGVAELGRYFGRLHGLLRPRGRLLNHGISVSLPPRGRAPSRTFTDRFVFPDGELTDVGRVVSVLSGAGLEPRHVESLREHYALTLRAWVANLERVWDQAVCEAGETTTRIWHLYMAASALNFEADRTSVFQVLAVRPEQGRSGLPLRPRFDGR